MSVPPLNLLDRRVKSLLNELTMENFYVISGRIIVGANESISENNARSLLQVIQLVIEEATKEDGAKSEVCAHLCRRMMERVHAEVKADGVETTDGKSLAGGKLFKKFLVDHCRDDFERVFAERCATQSGLGLVKFIGGLFKMKILTERFVHDCVQKLLHSMMNPGEEEVEFLCSLLTIVGGMLDSNRKARVHMDIYFGRVEELSRASDASPQMRSMLLVCHKFQRIWLFSDFTLCRAGFDIIASGMD